ncbi:DUF1631 domain-containing protein [Marinobacter nauticus]
MAHDNNVVRFSGQSPMDRFSMPTELVRLRDKSGQALKQVLARFFEQSDDHLFALADRAGSNQDQTAYFDAMRELRMRRKSMTVSMLQYISEAFNDLGRFKPASSQTSLEKIDQDSLGLVDHAELEQQVAIDNLTTRLRNSYQEPVRLLAARIRHLVPELKLSDEQMPLSPEVICAAIGEACADLDIDIRAKLVVLKLFERLMVDKLEAFYQDCNQVLIADGVLPDMKRPPVEGEAVKASKSASASEQPANHVPTAPGGTRGSATFHELSALLHQGQGASAVPTGQPTGRVLETQQLMGQLDKLQVAARTPANDEIVPLREQLQPLLQAAEGANASVAQADGDVINLVAMLFDFILEDRQLHPVMKALISRLQIPVLKVALNDRNFFNRGGHPVRKLLNELALAAIGWTEKRPGLRDPLREKMEEVVGRILDEFTTGTELFEELLEDFGHFMDLDRRRRELVEQRLRDAEEGRAKQERASQLATEVIQAQIAGRDIPEPVEQALHEPWMRYLQWVLLRRGEGSEQWQQACDVTARLVWSVDPAPVTDTTRTELLRAIPQVVDDVRKALQEISWDPFATDTVIRDLELAHVDAFQKLVTAPVNKAAPQPPAEPEPAATEEQPAAPAVEAISQAGTPVPEPEAAPAPSIAAEWLARADQLRVGSWVEMQGEEHRVRCKLAAFIRATGKYIFVNRSGAKVAEYHREGLAEALEIGLITMLDDGLIFDRALESIIDNLRHNRKD